MPTSTMYSIHRSGNSFTHSTKGFTEFAEDQFWYGIESVLCLQMIVYAVSVYQLNLVFCARDYIKENSFHPPDNLSLRFFVAAAEKYWKSLLCI
jgi:hypothetical protein